METSNNNTVNLGSSLTLSALQLTLLCDRAIERYLKMLKEYDEENESRILIFSQPPTTTEAARDEVVELFKSQAEETKTAE